MHARLLFAERATGARISCWFTEKAILCVVSACEGKRVNTRWVE